MELTTSTVSSTVLAVDLCFAFVVSGCASPSRLAAIDAKYDRILAEHCGGDKQVCWVQEGNRQIEKENANSFMSRLGYTMLKVVTLGLGGGGTAGSQTGYVYIMNP